MATTLLSHSLLSASILNSNNNCKFCYVGSIQSSKPVWKSCKVRAIKEETEEKTSSSASASAEEITKKYGLEAGLWQ
ncbi:hypothetical protein CISIN_1g0295001mg, partial [Citrus sinensis]